MSQKIQLGHAWLKLARVDDDSIVTDPFVNQMQILEVLLHIVPGKEDVINVCV